jgi:hypothetical protein
VRNGRLKTPPPSILRNYEVWIEIAQDEDLRSRLKFEMNYILPTRHFSPEQQQKSLPYERLMGEK